MISLSLNTWNFNKPFYTPLSSLTAHKSRYEKQSYVLSIVITWGIVGISLHLPRIERTPTLVRLHKDRRSENEDSRVCSHPHWFHRLSSADTQRHTVHPDCIYPTSPDITIRPKISSWRTLNPLRNLDFVFGAGRARRHTREPRKFSVRETPPVNFLPWRKFTLC